MGPNLCCHHCLLAQALPSQRRRRRTMKQQRRMSIHGSASVERPTLAQAGRHQCCHRLQVAFEPSQRRCKFPASSGRLSLPCGKITTFIVMERSQRTTSLKLCTAWTKRKRSARERGSGRDTSTRTWGTQARTRHASSMFQTLAERTKKSKNPHDNRIELVDFVAMFFPHLGRSAIQRACDYYAEKPPPPKPIKTFEQKLDEVPEAREEIRAIFERLDGDKDGLVRMKSLEPMMIEHGISESDVQGWLQEGATGEMCRMKSKLDVEDMQRLLGPVYIPPSPKDNNDCVSEGKEISKSIDRQHAILLDVMYGKCR